LTLLRCIKQRPGSLAELFPKFNKVLDARDFCPCCVAPLHPDICSWSPRMPAIVQIEWGVSCADMFAVVISKFSSEEVLIPIIHIVIHVVSQILL
jgi:hypothetical protein